MSTVEPPDVIDDYDFTEEDLAVFMRPENLEKLAKRCNTYKFVKISEFRPGKRLLVLDIDYTIFGTLFFYNYKSFLHRSPNTCRICKALDATLSHTLPNKSL